MKSYGSYCWCVNKIAKMVIDNDKVDFVTALQSDGVHLRHVTTTANWQHIKRDGYLKPHVADIDKLADPAYLPKLRMHHIPISAVYFQLVKNIWSRFDNPDDNVVELFFTPTVLLSTNFVLHPVGWLYGLDSRFNNQYCSSPELADQSSVDLNTAYHNIQYWDNNDHMNEILITDRVSLDYCVQVY